MKRFFCIALSLLMVVAAMGGCKKTETVSAAAAPAAPAAETASAAEAAPEATEAPVAGMVSPMTPYATLADLHAANPELHMTDVPEGAADVAIDTITGAEISPIGQILFTLDGCDYTYRAAACESVNAMGDIAGVYDEFTNAKELASENSLTDGGTYLLQYNNGSPMGLATWYYEPTKCQYSLFTRTGCGEDQKIEEVVDELLNVPGYDPEPVSTEPTVDGTVSGTVVAVKENSITINMENGNTLTFSLTYVGDSPAKVGDKVDIDFSGDITEGPEAVKITVTLCVPLVLSGTVLHFDDTSLTIQDASGHTHGFVLSSGTTISGKAKKLAVGDSVTVTTPGDNEHYSDATNIEITDVAIDEKLVNKKLSGYVTSLKTKTFAIETDNGKTWTFHKDDTTEITGKYDFENGAKVTVVYDGYASKHPVAKTVKVTAPPDPNPPTPSYHTVSGTIDSYHGVFLTLTNGYGFNLSGARLSGDTDAGEGDKAKVTYYEDGGTLYATKVVFTAVDYNPVVYGPGPVVNPDIGDGVIVGESGPVIGEGVTVG